MPLRTHLDEAPTLNLTAMLDVMFLLIIFFVLNTKFMDDERQIGLSVPQVADRGALAGPSQRKTINVYRDGTIMLDQSPVTLEELTARLAAARGQSDRMGVLVRGDGQGEFQQVAAVLNACKQAGIGDLGISVRLGPCGDDMAPLRLSRPWTVLSGEQWMMALLLAGLAALSITLIVAIWTRWGQFRPLRKCLIMSLLGHLLLAGYATTVKIVSLAPSVREPVLHVTFEGPIARVEWLAGPGDGPENGIDPDEVEGPAEEPTPPVPKPVEPPRPKETAAMVPPSPPPLAVPAPKSAAVPKSEPTAAWTVVKAAGKYLHNADEGPTEDMDTEPDAAEVETAPAAGPAVQAAAPAASSAPAASGPAQPPLPEPYRLRVAADHVGAAVGGGGSPQTEAAVQAAIRWLTETQSADGRWDAKRHGAGRETLADGRSRPHAGLDADTGMTGLAPLALLARGETHLRGDHQETVRRGLEFLLRSQDAEGSLAGSSDRFAAMYCHAMATFALSEAYGMTGDRRLEQPLRRALGYTIAAQDAFGGGWRYRPRDPGDTSQLGWQFMALKSAELAGIPIPDETRQGIVRYLQSVASGVHGGRAAYRRGEQPSHTMTAEAMVCWQFLGLAREHPACNEAGDDALSALPGEGRPNFYYWYYATLATHQLQGKYWQQWNEALRRQLLATQQTTGSLAGTWDPDPIWGGYGGRIYSTALGALCLEVYYRYLPLYGREK